MWRRIVGVVVAGVAVFLVAEVGLRLAGFIDVPLIERSERQGYAVKPSQSGDFMRRYDWAINERRMGVARPFAPRPETTDVLLVGDSVVFGFPPYTQATRLGPTLERLLPGAAVWPLAADSWSLLSQLTMLQDEPDLAASVDRIVFVHEPGDFGQRSQWRSALSQPTAPPLSAVWYVAFRYVLPKGLERLAPLEPPGTRDWRAEFDAFLAATDKPVTSILYPHGASLRAEGGVRSTFPIAAFEALAEAHPHFRFVVIDRATGWRADFYRDDIHPKAAHNEDLARIIAAAMGR